MTVSRTICLGFLAVIAVGAFLLMTPLAQSSGTWGSWVTALFTSTSAVCVTGLSVVDVGSYYTFFGELLIVLLVQIGGLGYMTATTFLLLLLGRRFGLRDKLALQQSLDTTSLSGVVHLVRSIIITTLFFEFTGFLVLLAIFSKDYSLSEALWLAIFHSVNSFNNAGFSLFSNNLIDYQSSLSMNLIVSLLIIFGGIGYQVIMEIYFWIKDRSSYKNSYFRTSLNFKIAVSTTLFLLITGTFAVLFTEFTNPHTLGILSLPHKFLAAYFQSVTARTAGFNTIDIGQMRIAGLFIIIVLMFLGASPGSTGGGIKTTTATILFMCTQAALKGREEVICFQRQIPMPLIVKAVGVLIGSIIVVIFSTVLIALANPEFVFSQVFFEVVSAFGTVGLSTGITAKINWFSQLVLVATMYTGRVGVLLLMSAIHGDPKPSSVSYPEANLLVG